MTLVNNSKAMLNTLASGTSLVVDRYAYSGMAYTLAKKLPGLNAQVGTCNVSSIVEGILSARATVLNVL